MAEKYLGATFDIHGGGVDLVFPHHENELAQSQAVGDGFARYWLHNAWVTTSGEKMSKSLGNSLLVSEIVQRVRPVELRYYLGSAHYRSHIEFSEGALTEAAAGFRRIEGFIERASRLAAPPVDAPLPDAFVAAMDDDLSVPAALAVLHDTVRAGNAALTADDKESVAAALGAVLAMTTVLGVNPQDEPWPGAETDGDALAVVDALVALALRQREEARARKDFAAADAVRDALQAAGVAIEDTPSGPRATVLRVRGSQAAGSAIEESES
jgi:cysteinyl-tRNA synthetase